MNIRNYRKTLLDWVISKKFCFSYKTGNNPRQELELLKPYGEFVLSMDILLRNSPNDELFLDCLRWAWGQAENGEYFGELLTARPDLILISCIYATFHKYGFVNSKVLDLIKFLSGRTFAKYIPYPNWRRLDLERALENLKIKQINEITIRNCWCMNTPEPWIIEEDTAYALTHEIFYLTDFGDNPHGLPSNVINYLKLWLPVWKKIYVEKGNWDLYSEFIMVQVCVSKYEEKNPFARLYKVVNEKGYLPGQDGGGNSLKSETDDQSRKDFLTHYHTTLVGLISSDMWLSKFGNDA